MPATLVLLADGSEEMEAVIAIDVLRRAGWPVTVAAIGTDRLITASRGVQIIADTTLSACDASSFDLLILPGGKGGAESFASNLAVLDTLRMFDKAGKTIAAICAAPLALEAAGILPDRPYTCYPGIESQIHHGRHSRNTVVRDANLITSQGPGTAFEFTLALVAHLESKKAADVLRRQMLLT